MAEKKTPEEVVEEMKGAEFAELDDHDLEGVAGGDFDAANGNCGGLCSPGDKVPEGSWENGNCR